MNRQDAEKIITEYLKPIFGFALKRCKSIHDAEDLSQEIAERGLSAPYPHGRRTRKLPALKKPCFRPYVHGRFFYGRSNRRLEKKRRYQTDTSLHSLPHIS